MLHNSKVFITNRKTILKGITTKKSLRYCSEIQIDHSEVAFELSA